MKLKTMAVLACLLLSGASGGVSAAEWNFNDPEIAAATFGMLTPLLQKDFCPGISLQEARFTETLKLQKFLPEDIRKNCDDCYLKGLSGAKTILDQTGKDNYCQSIVKMFGKEGTMVPGLVTKAE